MATEHTARELLAAIKGWRHWVGNDMLDQLGVPKIEGRMDRDVRFLQRMLQAGADAERTMLEYFEVGTFAHDHDVWPEPGLRLFISHISESKARLLPLATELSRYGIHCFLAHEAIKPAKNWRDVLLNALGTMDALLSFHSVGFRDSEWCGQEVGYALGRGTNVIAVLDGEAPAGFLGAIQGIPWKPDTPRAAADAVVECLLANYASSSALGDALARQLKFAGSWDRSGFCIDGLQRCGELSQGACRSIELALQLNDQVRGNEYAMALIGQDEAVPA